MNSEQPCLDAAAEDGLERGARAQLKPREAMGGTEVPEVVAETCDLLAVRANDGLVCNERGRGRVLSVNQLGLLVQNRFDVLVGNYLHDDGGQPAVHQESQA